MHLWKSGGCRNVSIKKSTHTKHTEYKIYYKISRVYIHIYLAKFIIIFKSAFYEKMKREIFISEKRKKKQISANSSCKFLEIFIFIRRLFAVIRVVCVMRAPGLAFCIETIPADFFLGSQLFDETGPDD